MISGCKSNLKMKFLDQLLSRMRWSRVKE